MAVTDTPAAQPAGSDAAGNPAAASRPAALEPDWGEAWRAGLDAYDLGPEDRALIETSLSAPFALAQPTRGSVAVVGRPNVGKSTLVNRIVGRREAVVLDTPGVTRDRVSYPAEWAGHAFAVVDTGGWEVDVRGMAARVAEQAEVAIDLADAVILVVDATVGVTDTDEQVVRLLRRSGKPVVLAANKVDGPAGESDATALWALGLGEPMAVSALHGRGIGELLDAVVALLPVGAAASSVDDAVRRVALVGRPNVGKSSLLNKLVGRERAVVDARAGTTRDPVDEDVFLGGRRWRFVDTAGIRRRVHLTSGADYYASLRTQAAIERAEVAVVLVDASERLSEQDIRVIQMAVDQGRATVLALNKWDLMDTERRVYLERELDQELVQLRWIQRVNISALTGRRVDRLPGALDLALANWDRRIPTGQLNAFLGELVSAHPHPVRGGKQPRILFATQASARPPHFVIFASGFLDPGYRRFIERRLRETFDFTGTPIAISVRARQRRQR
jgi:GTP-binding protein